MVWSNVEFGGTGELLGYFYDEMNEIRAHIFWDYENMSPQTFIPDYLKPKLFGIFETALLKHFEYISLAKVTAFGNELQVNTDHLDEKIVFEHVPNRGPQCADRRIYAAVMEAVVSERESGHRPCIVIISADGGYLETLKSLKGLKDHNGEGVFVRAISCIVAKSRTVTFELYEAADCAWSPSFFYGGGPWKPCFHYSSFQKFESTLLPVERLPLLRQPLAGRCQRFILPTLLFLREELLRPDFVNIGSYLFYFCSAFRKNVSLVNALIQVRKYLDLVCLIEGSTGGNEALDKYIDRNDPSSVIYVVRGSKLYDFQDPYPFFDFAFEASYVQIVADHVWEKIPVGVDLNRLSRLMLAAGAYNHLKSSLRVTGVKGSVWGWLKVSHVLVMVEFVLAVGRGYKFGISGVRIYASNAYRSFVSRKIMNVRLRSMVLGLPLRCFDVPDHQYMEV